MKRFIIITSIILLFILVQQTGFSQCPMCKMAAESNMKSGGSVGKGLNTGILYLLAMPYLLFIVFIYLWKRIKNQTEVL